MALLDKANAEVREAHGTRRDASARDALRSSASTDVGGGGPLRMSGRAPPSCAGVRMSGTSDVVEPPSPSSAEPPTLALVHLASQEGVSHFALLVGSGDAAAWSLPHGMSRLAAADCATLSLPGFLHAPPCAVRALALPFGTVAPGPLPRLAFGTCLLLLGSELVLSTFVLGTLCSAPPPPGSPSAGLNLTGCAGTLLCLPFAGLLSPMIGLWSFVSSALDARAAAAAGRERALGGVVGKAGRAAAAADGAVIVRRLHASAVWNCASLPNAVVAIVAFAWVPDDLFIAEWPWLLPVALLVAKLLLAQALKEVAAASGVDRGARAALRALGE